MSSLWTPSGERPIPRPDAAPRSEPSVSRSRPDGPPTGGQSRVAGSDDATEPTEAELAAAAERLRATPVEVVVANHCYGLFELAALHLSADPPGLEPARLAIDAMAALVEGLRGRLGESEATLTDGLAQLRLAWVQLSNLPPPPATPPVGDRAGKTGRGSES